MNQRLRLFCIAATGIIVALSILYDNAPVGLIAAFLGGMWSSAYLRRVAEAHGIHLADGE